MYIFDPNVASAIPDEEKKEKAKRDIEQIRDSALAISKKMETPDLSKIMDTIRYRIAMRIPLVEEAESRIRIMTLHGAKGLEADSVVIAGVADQIIPGILSPNPEENQREREERRRLLYVSITRAKQDLIISWPKSMDYKDAMKNKIRVDKRNVWKRGAKKWVNLSKTGLLPDIYEIPKTGDSWIKSKLGKT